MPYAVVGKSVTREDGSEKVSGRTCYAGDLMLPGMLWGKVLRSPLPIHTKGDERDPRFHTPTLHKPAPVMPGPGGPEQARGKGGRAGWRHAEDHRCLTRRAVKTPHTAMPSARLAV